MRIKIGTSEYAGMAEEIIQILWVDDINRKNFDTIDEYLTSIARKTEKYNGKRLNLGTGTIEERSLRLLNEMVLANIADWCYPNKP